MQVRVITPHSGLAGFSNALSSLLTAFRPARQLAWRFFLRDTQADHRQSLLGYAWLVMVPLANTLVWVFLNNQNVINIATGSVPYPIFVLSGTILWTAFNGSLMSMLTVVNSARGMLAKVNFPHEALPYAAFLKSSVDALIASMLLVPALLIYQVPLNPSMLLYPVALVASLLLGCGFGLIALPLAALYPDIGRIVQLGLRFGFFLTPVIFPLPADGFARKLMLLNPVTPAIVSGRAWLTGSGEAMPTAFTVTMLACIALIATALVFYKISVPHLIERLGG